MLQMIHHNQVNLSGEVLYIQKKIGASYHNVTHINHSRCQPSWCEKR